MHSSHHTDKTTKIPTLTHMKGADKTFTMLCYAVTLNARQTILHIPSGVTKLVNKETTAGNSWPCLFLFEWSGHHIGRSQSILFPFLFWFSPVVLLCMVNDRSENGTN